MSIRNGKLAPQTKSFIVDSTDHFHSIFRSESVSGARGLDQNVVRRAGHIVHGIAGRIQQVGGILLGELRHLAVTELNNRDTSRAERVENHFGLRSVHSAVESAVAARCSDRDELSAQVQFLGRLGLEERRGEQENAILERRLIVLLSQTRRALIDEAARDLAQRQPVRMHAPNVRQNRTERLLSVT